jgi:hypothetical protein
VAGGPDNRGAAGAENSTAEGTLGTPTYFLIELVQISGVHLIVPGGSGPPDPPGQLRRWLQWFELQRETLNYYPAKVHFKLLTVLFITNLQSQQRVN